RDGGNEGKGGRAQGRQVGVPGKHRGAFHDRRGRDRRWLLAGRAPDVAARAGGAAPQAQSRGGIPFVLEGKMGALLGDEVLTAEAGDLVFKPRDQWHTFWNA